MKNNIKKILEIIWLIVAIISFFLAIHAFWLKSFKDIIMFFVISAISLGMYFFRRQSRKINNGN